MQLSDQMIHTSAAPVPRRLGYWPLVPAVGALAVVVTTVGFLAPLLVLIAGDFGISTAQAGGLVVLTTIPWALVAPFSGLLSDRLGRRPVVLIALMGMGVATILGSFATGFWVLAALRLATGVFGSGGPPTVMAGVVDHYPVSQRGTAIGWCNTSFSVAGLLTIPLIGAVGGLWGWRTSFFVTGCALLAIALFFWLAFPKTPRPPLAAGHPFRVYGDLFRLPYLPTYLASNFCERVTFMAVSLYLASFLIEAYSLTPVSVAPALSLTALGAITGALAGGLLADRWSRTRLAAVCLAASGLFGLAAFGWSFNLLLSVALGFGFGLSNAASRPPFMSLVLGLSDASRGALNGLIAMSNQIGWAIGAGVGGIVIGFAGFRGLGPLIGVFALLSAVLVLIARPRVHPATAAVASTGPADAVGRPYPATEGADPG